MVDLTRRLISELVTRYVFHPELRDFYVEGERDKAVFQWFFSKVPGSTAVVYQVDNVELTAETVASVGVVGHGNKGRLVALARILEEQLPLHHKNILCCADKDFHDFGITFPSSRYLVYTDFSCLECYALDSSTIIKLFQFYFCKQITQQEIESMLDILCHVFLTRLIKQRLAPAAKWFDEFTKCCSLASGSVQLDIVKYRGRVLNAAAGALPGDDLDKHLARSLSLPIQDKRYAMQGHDIIQMISWFARMKGVAKEIASDRVVQRVLLTMIELDDVRDKPLFVDAADWSTT